MVCVGIDAACNKHDVCITNDAGKIFGNVFTIKNTKEDYKKLLEQIKTAKEYFNDDKVTLGIESTGSYSSVITEFLAKEDDIDVILINPILTNMYQQLRKVHYAKTDTIDAIGIASFVATKPCIRTYTPPSYHIRELKEMYREVVNINKSLSKCKTRLKSTLHRYFPEYLYVFTDISSKSSLHILENYKDIRKLKNVNSEKLLKQINNKSGGNITRKKVRMLQEYVLNSIGDLSNYNGVVISCLARQISLYLEQKEELIKTMEPLIKEEGKELLSIPGINTILAAGILSEINNIDNFNNADQLVAYAGLDPIVYESGTYKAKNTRISKKGSSYLREALYYASFTVTQNDKNFNKYYCKKIDEGKKHRVVLGHVAKKLCRLIFCLLNKHKDYVSPIK